MDFTVEYQPSPDEVTRAFRLGWRRQRWMTSWGLTAICLAGAAVCALLGAVASSVGLVAGAIAAPIASAWAWRRLYRRAIGQLSVPATVRVTGDGYEIRTELYSATVRWAMFNRVESTPEFWLLYGNRVFAAFIPRAAFDKAQLAEIDSILAPRAAAA